MYSFVFIQIWTCCRQRLLMWTEVTKNAIQSLPGRAWRKTWWRFRSTILIPKSQLVWVVWPITTSGLKNDFKCWTEQYVGAHQISGSWSFGLQRNICKELSVSPSEVDEGIPALDGLSALKSCLWRAKAHAPLEVQPLDCVPSLKPLTILYLSPH